MGPLSRRQFLLTSLATSVLLLGNRAFGAAEDLTRLSLQELQSGSRVTTPAYIQACRELDRIRRTIGNIFSSVDLLVTPTTPILPITIEEAKNKPEDWRSIRNTSPFSIYGLPGISIPCGFSRSGLPIGLQICGPYLGEPQILALAYAYEQETDWHTQRPASAKDIHPS